ncbi:MAG: hypothetical protein OSA89_03630 [Mariniblastus sp.]|nr:hypothetical protein [Mariniblastus sp.]
MDNLNQASPDSSILGNCLSCQGLVRVPVKSSADSKVRCPHCSNEYRLSEILDESVPALEIIDDAQQPVAIAPVIKEPEPFLKEVFVVPPQLSDGAKRKRRKRKDQSEGGSDSRRAAAGRPSSREERRSRKRSRSDSKPESRSRGQKRTSKSPRNPAIEFIKVVVGGLMAIPIAYAIVLWAFNKDPLNVGPQISEYVPIVIPADFQVDPKSDLNSEK